MIKTLRLVLRERLPVDREFFADIYTDPRVQEMGISPKFRPTQRQAIYDGFDASAGSTNFRRVMVERGSGKRVGLMFANSPNNELMPEHMVVSYYLTPSFWGKGYATEAVEAIQKHFASSSACSGLCATVHVGNVASQRVLLKRGFVEQRDLEWLEWDMKLFAWAIEKSKKSL